MQKEQMIEDKAGAICAGCSDGDVQQLRYFFSLLVSYFASFLLYSLKPHF
jgi:hypothetical protein